MPKQKRKRVGSKHRQRYTILCEWCGERRETAREDTKTCGTRCRARLNFYVRYLGYEPDEIVGPLTGHQAVDLELHRLITNEQHRRASEAAMLEQYLARPGA